MNLAERLEDWWQADDCNEQELDDIIFEIRDCEKAKNNAYAERDKLVLLLASIYPSWLNRHEEEDLTWEDDWRWIIFIELPTGQASWHIHDSEVEMFRAIGVGTGAGTWDGHSTEEKYLRIGRAAARQQDNKHKGYCSLCGRIEK